MRTLPAGLAAAQQSVSTQPVITVVLRAKRGAAARLDPTTLYSNTLADVACAVAAPKDGFIVRAHLSGGNVQTQHLAASAGSSWTSWSTLAGAIAPAAGLGVALAASLDTVAVAYLQAAGTIAVRRSSDDGVTWGTAQTVAAAAVFTDVALAYAPNGDLLLAAGDNGGTIRAWRSNGGGAFGGAVSLVPPAGAFINSVALAYPLGASPSNADWLALFGWQDATLNHLGSAIFGNGGQQAVNSWSSVIDILGIAPGSAANPIVSGFAWGATQADGGQAILVEQWAIPGGYNANPAYAMHCSSPAAFKAGYWTEPEPFAATGSGQPVTGVNGADLATSQVPGQGSSYACAAENLVTVLTPPADLDVSARIIAFDYEAGAHSGNLTVALDNADGGISALATSRATIGLRCDLALGYPVAGVNTTSPFPLRWVVKGESSWHAGRAIVTLTCHDGWQLLHQLTARRQAQFGTTLGLPALTVDQIIHWLCARVGIDYTPPAASTLGSRTPAWTLLPGHSLGAQMLDLLDKIEGFLLMTDTGATVIPLGAGEASTYSYGAAGQHPIAQVFHTQELQPANLITVYNGAQGNVIAAQAFDSADARLLGYTAHDHTDTQLEPANAQATANALLRKAQLSAPLYNLTCQPQVAQELGDAVTITDPLTNTSYTARVRSFSIHFDRDKGTWLQRLSLSAV